MPGCRGFGELGGLTRPSTVMGRWSCTGLLIAWTLASVHLASQQGLPSPFRDFNTASNQNASTPMALHSMRSIRSSCRAECYPISLIRDILHAPIRTACSTPFVFWEHRRLSWPMIHSYCDHHDDLGCWMMMIIQLGRLVSHRTMQHACCMCRRCQGKTCHPWLLRPLCPLRPLCRRWPCKTRLPELQQCHRSPTLALASRLTPGYLLL